MVAEAIERQEENEARAEAAELEVDELKASLLTTRGAGRPANARDPV
ncbi:hypothetical protein ACLK11_05275 [Escherichia coli]